MEDEGWKQREGKAHADLSDLGDDRESVGDLHGEGDEADEKVGADGGGGQNLERRLVLVGNLADQEDGVKKRRKKSTCSRRKRKRCRGHVGWRSPASIQVRSIRLGYYSVN